MTVYVLLYQITEATAEATYGSRKLGVSTDFKVSINAFSAI